ncbi:MAG: hypothetical protein HY908_18690 [Myxococcales bacterium]|nr:hypothetical protein [Myxococcales bacterium]
MRNRSYLWLAPTLLFAVIGCKGSPKDRIQGRWIGERVDSFHGAQAGRASGWATGASFEFKGSRVKISIPAESPREGTYQIAKASAEELTVNFLRQNGDVDTATFRFEGDDRLRWNLGDGRSVVLRRAGN